jgi:hypothetical protein
MKPIRFAPPVYVPPRPAILAARLYLQRRVRAIVSTVHVVCCRRRSKGDDGQLLVGRLQRPGRHRFYSTHNGCSTLPPTTRQHRAKTRWWCRIRSNLLIGGGSVAHLPIAAVDAAATAASTTAATMVVEPLSLFVLSRCND